jgi:hypothetical protein
MPTETVDRKRGSAMTAVKYLLMGMGVMALLVVGSCSMLTYSAVKVAESAAANGGDAIDRIEAAADRQVTRARNEEFYREAAASEDRSDEDYSGYGYE